MVKLQDMNFQRWWLPATSILLLGTCLAAYPLLQNSLLPSVFNQPETSASKKPAANRESSQATATQLASTDAVLQQVKPTVVMVYGADGVGSGMILRSPGIILTNKHIVDNFATVKVQIADGTIYDGTVVDFDLQHDLALIKLKQSALNLPIITLAEQVNVRAGDRVYAIGSPGGKAGTLTSGTFTRITPEGSLQTSVGLLNPGNSGGPLLNQHGIVIGVNKGLLKDKSGLATPVAAAKSLLKRYETVNK